MEAYIHIAFPFLTTDTKVPGKFTYLTLKLLLCHHYFTNCA